MDFLQAFLQSNFTTVTITVTFVVGIILYIRQLALKRITAFGFLVSFVVSTTLGIVYAATPHCGNPFATRGTLCKYPALTQVIFFILLLTIVMLLGILLGWVIGYGIYFVIQKTKENIS